MDCIPAGSTDNWHPASGDRYCTVCDMWSMAVNSGTRMLSVRGIAGMRRWQRKPHSPASPTIRSIGHDTLLGITFRCCTRGFWLSWANLFDVCTCSATLVPD
eukprot:9813165-Lingulodinium_polyedra.AAC.1